MGLSGPVPRRVEAATKAAVLELIDEAIGRGWEHRAACEYLDLRQSRAWRWRQRRADGTLDDRPVGGQAVHGLLASEQAAIVALFDRWGLVDRSHRKLAHRGSYESVVWVSPSTVSYTKNSIWIFDSTHFCGCPKVAVIAVMDLVTRKWLCEIVSGEETSTQVQVAFTQALEQEGLLELVAARQDAPPDPEDRSTRPILLAVSDNGPQMTSGSTREFMAMCAIAQHFGRPGTPTDQAWIESLFSHLKGDWPHLDYITDPAVLRAELAKVRLEYNTVRLHAGIGYVTPDDEHEGRGEKIRSARRAGLRRARRRRIDYHRAQRRPAGS